MDFRLIFDSTPLPCYVFQDRKIVLFNDALLRICGYTREELINIDPFDLIHPDDRAFVMRMAGKRLAGETGIPDNYHFRGLRKDGSITYLHGFFSLIMYNDKPAILGQLLDETEKVKTEQKYHQLKFQFEDVVESINDFIYMHDLEGRFIYLNPAAEQTLGYRASELVGRSIEVILAPRIRQNLPLYLANLRLSGRDRGIMLALTKGGQEVFLEYNSVVRQEYGEGVVRGVARDITEQFAARKKQEELLLGVIKAMARLVEQRDPYTAGHQHNVAQLATLIGESLGLTKRELKIIYNAAMLHDIGKTVVPSEILNKPGKLSALEFQFIRLHPEAGSLILHEIPYFEKEAVIVGQHHERLDGSGYPQGLKEKDILLEAQIIAVSDVVEAMGSHRPYRPALEQEEILQELERGRNTKYDPAIVEVVSKLIKKKALMEILS